MQPCRERFWKTSPAGACRPPQAFREQRTSWTLKFLPIVSPPVVAGPPKPCRTLTAPSHQHRFCLSSGPQTCPPLSRSLAPAVACLPRTASSPLPSPRASGMRLKCRYGRTAGSLAPSGKQGLLGLPHAPGRTWGDGSLTGPCSPLDPPLHHTKPHCLPGDRHPLALDLDTPALTPAPLYLPRASWALSAPTPLPAAALCTVSAHP